MDRRQDGDLPLSWPHTLPSRGHSAVAAVIAALPALGSGAAPAASENDVSGRAEIRLVDVICDAWRHVGDERLSTDRCATECPARSFRRPTPTQARRDTPCSRTCAAGPLALALSAEQRLTERPMGRHDGTTGEGCDDHLCNARQRLDNTSEKHGDRGRRQARGPLLPR